MKSKKAGLAPKQKTSLSVKSPARYDAGFKRQVVKEVLGGSGQTEVARSYGIRIQLVSRWVGEYKQGISWAVSKKQRAQTIAKRAEEQEKRRRRVEAEILKKGKHLLTQAPKNKYPFILEQTELKKYSVQRLCSVMKVTPTGYYGWKRERGKMTAYQKERVRQAKLVRQIFEREDGNIGHRPIMNELRSRGIRIGRERVRVLMQEQGLVCKIHQRP